jgi:predicted RNase H-like HicB family nuclease
LTGPLFQSTIGYHQSAISIVRARIPEEEVSMARRFTVIFEREEEGGYHVFCPVLPGCHTQGETIDEGVRNIREAIELYIDSLVEDGLPVPEEGVTC